jgi:hypothetical protein
VNLPTLTLTCECTHGGCNTRMMVTRTVDPNGTVWIGMTGDTSIKLSPAQRDHLIQFLTGE